LDKNPTNNYALSSPWSFMIQLLHGLPPPEGDITALPCNVLLENDGFFF
jgi:hypothetical protein